MQFSLIQKILLWIIPLVLAITVHEVAHGWVANKLGDPTAKQMGRLTLNPLKHIDLFGTIIMPGILLMLGGIVFGYAKPVPIGWRNLHNPRRDMALVAIAGPLTNAFMAVGWALVAKVAIWQYDAGHVEIGAPLYFMSSVGIMLNLVLLVLNLIPIPPLDGSRVVASFLTGTWARNYARIEPFGFLILLALLVLGVLGHVLNPAVQWLTLLINQQFNLPS
ncbi:MAG: site-2 protease family protein [Gammaproteobacteria bacterium]|nr:site-2 protease family protein [Gammaproteobacteria bacterium]